MKRLLIAILSVALLAAMLAATAASASAAETAYIDNADLVVPYLPDDQVVLEDSGGGLMTPDWVKSLVIVQMVIARATPEGTFEAAIPLLDHYQEMGINGIWLSPIFDTTYDTGGHYGNYGPHTLDPKMTGTDDYEEGWKIVKNFVDEAHKRNIRVFSEMVTWGVCWNTPLYEEKPAWFSGESSWGGYSFNWNNEELVKWFEDRLLYMVGDIGFDGFRCDLEPGATGYEMYGRIRSRALAERGRKIALFTEMTHDRLMPTYDFEQHVSEEYMWNTCEMYLKGYDLVESVKNGYGLGTKYADLIDEGGISRFYSMGLSSHDEPYAVHGDLVKIGYTAILAPFIPIWFMGEEFNNTQLGNSTLFLTSLDITALEDPANRAFFESVKELLRIRRQYPEIFDYFPENHRDSNICTVEVVGLETLNGYARYRDGKGILVVPNNNLQFPDKEFIVRVPFEEMGIPASSEYTVTDLRSGNVVAKGDRIALYDFKASVAVSDVGVYAVEATGKALASAKRGDAAGAAPAAAVENPAPAVAAPEAGLPEDEVVSEGEGELLSAGAAAEAKVYAAEVVPDEASGGQGPWALLPAGLAATCAAAFVLYRRKRTNKTP